MPIGSVGPSSMSTLMLKISQIGPTPLISLYYDLSYGKQPHTMLVVDASSESSPVLQMTQRWMYPKAPPAINRIRPSEPPFLNELLDNFLPASMSAAQIASEKTSIISFIRELNQVRYSFLPWKNEECPRMFFFINFQLRGDTIRRDFVDSYLVHNVSSLQKVYPFVRPPLDSRSAKPTILNII